MMDEASYSMSVKQVFTRLVKAIDAANPNLLDADSTGDMVTVTSMKTQEKVVVNTQRAVHQIWVAGKGQGLHFSPSPTADGSTTGPRPRASLVGQGVRRRGDRSDARARLTSERHQKTGRPRQSTLVTSPRASARAAVETVPSEAPHPRDARARPPSARPSAKEQALARPAWRSGRPRPPARRPPRPARRACRRGTSRTRGVTSEAIAYSARPRHGDGEALPPERERLPHAPVAHRQIRRVEAVRQVQHQVVLRLERARAPARPGRRASRWICVMPLLERGEQPLLLLVRPCALAHPHPRRVRTARSSSRLRLALPNRIAGGRWSFLPAPSPSFTFARPFLKYSINGTIV